MALKDMVKKMKGEVPSLKKAKPEFMADEEIDMELEPDAESDAMAGEEMEMDSEEAAPSPIADMEDEDILAELEARGMDVSALRAQLEEASAPEEEVALEDSDLALEEDELA